MVFLTQEFLTTHPKRWYLFNQIERIVYSIALAESSNPDEFILFELLRLLSFQIPGMDLQYFLSGGYEI